LQPVAKRYTPRRVHTLPPTTAMQALRLQDQRVEDQGVASQWICTCKMALCAGDSCLAAWAKRLPRT
jgi:hypothetical protein